MFAFFKSRSDSGSSRESHVTREGSSSATSSPSIVNDTPEARAKRDAARANFLRAKAAFLGRRDDASKHAAPAPAP